MNTTTTITALVITPARSFLGAGYLQALNAEYRRQHRRRNPEGHG